MQKGRILPPSSPNGPVTDTTEKSMLPLQLCMCTCRPGPAVKILPQLFCLDYNSGGGPGEGESRQRNHPHASTSMSSANEDSMFQRVLSHSVHGDSSDADRDAEVFPTVSRSPAQQALIIREGHGEVVLAVGAAISILESLSAPNFQAVTNQADTGSLRSLSFSPHCSTTGGSPCAGIATGTPQRWRRM